MSDPLTIAQERLAKGEISKEEYDSIVNVIQKRDTKPKKSDLRRAGTVLGIIVMALSALWLAFMYIAVSNMSPTQEISDEGMTWILFGLVGFGGGFLMWILSR